MISFFKILAYKAQTATMYCDTYLKAVQFIFLKDISPFEIFKKKWLIIRELVHLDLMLKEH